MEAVIAVHDISGLSILCEKLVSRGIKIITTTLASHECLFKNDILHQHNFETTKRLLSVAKDAGLVVANMKGPDCISSLEQQEIFSLIRKSALSPDCICLCDPMHYPEVYFGWGTLTTYTRTILDNQALRYISSLDHCFLREKTSSPTPCNVLVLGSGSREHAMVDKLRLSSHVKHIYVAPGNGGTDCYPNVTNIPHLADNSAIVDKVKELEIGFVCVGPEEHLVNGVTDALSSAGCPCFGPSKLAARLEGSKAFSKDFMKRHGIPTARYTIFTDVVAAKEFVSLVEYPIVIKVSGLAAGKGAILPNSLEESLKTLDAIMDEKIFGSAGDEVVIEERLEGEEVSVFAFCDGKSVCLMPGAQDHKRIFDDDKGPNTGGMGAYSPAPILTPPLKSWVALEVMQRVVDGAAAEGFPYHGVLYAGIIVTANGPFVLKFNCRFGDPETQAILPLLETDLFEILKDCVDGCLLSRQIQWSNKYCVAVVLSAKGYPSKDYEKGKEISCEVQHCGVHIYHAGTRKTLNNSTVTCGGRVLAVCAVDDELANAIKLSYSSMNSIGFENMHFRKDVGRKALRAPVRLGVLGSTRGTDLQYIIDAINRGWFRADICVVVSNKKSAYILERAASYGLKTVSHGTKGTTTRAEFDAKVTATLRENQVDLVLCIGYMRILSDEFVDEWENKVLNVHPSLLPEFAGGMDLNVHQEVLNAKKTKTGCTIHFVTKEVDGGPIVIQRSCKVFENDDADVLKDRVQALEGPAFIEAIQKVSLHNFQF